MAPLRAPLQGHPLSAAGDRGRGLYLHVPFCRVRCPYCDFATAPYTARAARRYVQALGAEARAAAPAWAGVPFETVFYGGGTPSRLAPADLEELAAAIGAALAVAPGAETTLEANPEDVTPERLAAWVRAGVTRVSLGVQSLDGAELARLGRGHGRQGALEAARRVAAAFGDWSLDLLYGFPGHGLESWRRTLAEATALGAPHVSAYHFTPEAGTPLGEAVRSGRVRVADDAGAAALGEAAAAALEAAGYAHYEISNFARPGHESRHNRLYWRRRSYLGLGPGAVSFRDERRRRNLRDAEAWAARVLAGRDAVEESEDVSARAALETFLLGLRLEEGVPWAEVAALGEAGRAWESAARALAAEGRLSADAAGVRVPRGLRRLTDGLVLELWERAEPDGRRVDSARGGAFNEQGAPPGASAPAAAPAARGT